MNGPGMTAFMVGFMVGGMVFWQVAAAVERFRRARRDFTATKNGLRTLVEMMWRRAVDAARGVMVAALVVAILFVLWRRDR